MRGGWLQVNSHSISRLHGEAPAVDGAAHEQTDYKFYCFGGEPRYLYVSCGLENHATARISFLKVGAWEFAPFGRDDYAPFGELPPKPACYGEMLELARELSAGMPFVRADFLVQGGRPRFSELTFTPCGGFMPFDPPEWDARLGELMGLEETGDAIE